MAAEPIPDLIRYQDASFESLLQHWKRGMAVPTVLVFAGMPRIHLEQAAREVASRLGRPLQRLKPASLASPYIGETEKNIDRVFAAAQASGAVLLFDEADDLFGQRAADSETSDPGAARPGSLLLSALQRHPVLAIQTSASVTRPALPRPGLTRVLVRFPPA